jgi:asparagine synthase (glutamine-hydrolysing)
MCGIFGGIGVTVDEAGVALAAIRRGNDGITVSAHGDVVLGSRRHLVKKSNKPGVGLGESDQPYASDDGRVHLVFNGELYNFAALREDLERSGRTFHTDGDTEVFLRLYERHGKAFVENRDIDSLFALAILDHNAGHLMITRDWPGRVPLFYYYDRDRRVFLFSSELKGLLALGWVPLGDAVELTPGDRLVLDLDSFALEAEPYFRPTARKTESPLMEVGRDLHHLLTRSANNRTMGDVPICTMFSGGLDSLLTTYYVLGGIDFERVDYRPTGYVFAVEGHQSEDVRRAKEAAKGFRDIGFELKEVRAPAETVVADLPDIVTTFETREIKALSVYPLPIYYYLAPCMRDDGFKVVIGGHGADELLGAYDAWKELKASHKVQINPKTRLRFMTAIHENMLRRASIIFMNRGPLEARFPFLQVELCEYALGIDPRWLQLSTENAEFLARLIEDRAGPRGTWTEQLSGVHAYLGRYLDGGGTHPEEADEETVHEMEKLLWKLPMIVAGAHAAAESFLPFHTLFNPKLRGQHGAGLTALEPMVMDRYGELGETDGDIFKAFVRRSFRLDSSTQA